MSDGARNTVENIILEDIYKYNIRCPICKTKLTLNCKESLSDDTKLPCPRCDTILPSVPDSMVWH